MKRQARCRYIYIIYIYIYILEPNPWQVPADVEPADVHGEAPLASVYNSNDQEHKDSHESSNQGVGESDKIEITIKTNEGVGDSDKIQEVSTKTDKGVGESDKIQEVCIKTDKGVGVSDKSTCGVSIEIEPKVLDSASTAGDASNSSVARNNCYNSTLDFSNGTVHHWCGCKCISCYH